MASDGIVIATELLLTGDVMTGRGIDQIMPRSVDPVLYEPWIRDARDYVRLAEERNGPIPRSVDAAYVWGDAIDLFTSPGIDARIVNLETAVTDWPEPWPDKGINYRMHPANVGCIAAGRVDCCVLANNHVLDWSHPGLVQTLGTLRAAGLPSAGAGADLEQAGRPAVVPISEGRVIVVAAGMPSSGIPPTWAAGRGRAGVAYAPVPSPPVVADFAARLDGIAEPGDIVVASVHWGPNWGYDIPQRHRTFARALIDEADVHIVHGHSSHHPLAIEVYRDRPILYGCGDLIDDYEGISGHEEYRPDLRLVHHLTMDAASGVLVDLRLVPYRSRRFRLEDATRDDRSWLAATLDRQCATVGTRVRSDPDGTLSLVW